MKHIFILGCIILSPVITFAHATPVEYSPDEFATVSSTPNEVMIRFSERVEPTASSIDIYAPNGVKLPHGTATVNQTDTHIFSRDTTSGGEGIYTVSWQVVSADDGHFTKGAFPFFVGSGTTTATLYGGTVEMVYSTGYSEATTIFLKLLGESMLVGLLALFFFFGKQRQGSEELHRVLVERGKKFAVVALLVLLVGTVAYVLLKASLLAEVQSKAILTALPAFLGTVAGKLSLLLIFLVPVFAFLSKGILDALINRKRLTTRHVLALLCILAMSYAQARLSHAAASHLLPTFSVFVNLIHLFGKGLWIGSLTALAFVFLPVIATKTDYLKFRPLVRKIFGYATVWAVLLGGPTGAWIVWLHMKGLGNLWSSAWGNVFITLGLFALVLVALRLISLFVLERMKRCADCEHAYAYFETGVGLCVMFFSAVIIITSPPLYHDGLWMKMVMERGTMVHLSDPGEGSGGIRINGIDVMGDKVSGNAPVVTITNSKENIGPLVVKTNERGKGNYDIPGTLLSPPGEWKVNITFQQKATYDVNGAFVIDYPKEITDARVSAKALRFGFFEALLIGVGVMAIVFAYALYFLIRRNAVMAEIHPEYVEGGATIGKTKAAVIALTGIVAITALVLMAGSVLLRTVGDGPQDMHAMHQM